MLRAILAFYILPSIISFMCIYFYTEKIEYALFFAIITGSITINYFIWKGNKNEKE